MEIEIPDTSSDSSEDTIIVTNEDESKSEPPQFSSATDSELDRLFKKYLNDDYVSKSTTETFSKLPLDESKIATFQGTEILHSKVVMNYSTEKNDLYSRNSDEFDDPQPSTSRCVGNLTMTTHEEDLSSQREPLAILDDTAHFQFSSKLSHSKKFYELDADDLPVIDIPNSLKPKRIKRTNNEIHSSNNSSGSSIENNILDDNPAKTTKKSTNEQKLLEKEELRMQKLIMKEQKKEEERKSKAVKNALASHYKNMKPEHCTKFIKVHIDEELKSRNFLEDISSELGKNFIFYKFESQLTKNSISWTRQIQSHILDSNGEVISTSDGATVDEILIIMDCNEFINHIHFNTFFTHIESLISLLHKKKIIFVIYELQKYFKFQKNKRNQQMRQQVSSAKTFKTCTDQKLFDNLPVVSRRTIEYALTEIQLLHSISHKMVETKQDIGLMVFQLTKSIAQVPYKLQKQEQFQNSKWFMSEDKRNCIKIDKNGNGLSRLWKQVITTFPLATLETAEAISAGYPTPLALIKAYEAVSNDVEGEKLLQDIPIRRNAGPISTMRKVGPELSKKMYYLLMSRDPDKVL